MARYRTSKLAWEVLRKFALGKISRVSDQWSSSLSSSRYGHLGWFKQNPNCLLVSANRKYFSQLKTDFSSLSLLSPKFGYPQRKYYYGLIGTALAATAYWCNQETIPFSKRTHSILVPRVLEKKLGEHALQHIKHKEKVLPATHPQSKRVTLVAEKLIGALQMSLRDDRVHGASQYWEHFDWEVTVIDIPEIHASVKPGGKIIVSSGLLEHYKSDTRVAALIGREVAHAVARHYAEMLTKYMWLSIIGLLLNSFEFITLSYFYVTRPLSRKLELEADYMGLLLMASAGYDPRVMVKLWEEYAESEKDGTDIFSEYPSDKKRFQFITAQALEEAMTLFKLSLSTSRP